MSAAQRQRVDLWLHRARLAKTRAAAARLISEGGVRLVHDGLARRIEKPSVEVAPGDALVLPQRGRLVAIKVEALGARRGPASEARLLYVELDADALG
ncbi:MAG: S4 domain-containing protein [Hyphomonadaceae bacterium JAD_PAG50586_4]|nr:MAG: S4 domain-containing protein [Hyphomonadaceae bacterium JAD_PAG50586_4]